MFAIAVPSTLRLYAPPKQEDGEPLDYATLDFFHPSDDVSKCRIRVTTADGDVHEATFNVGGGQVDRYYASAEDLAKEAEAAKALEAEDEARRERDQASAAAQAERELKTADDTTAADVAYDAPHEEHASG